MDKVKGKSTTPPINSPVPQQPVESSTKPSFCSRCSKPIWCLLIAILVVAVIAIGGYYFLAVRNATPVVLNQQPPVTPMPTPTPDLTANWKTYINSAYHYSFRYPQAFSPKEDGAGSHVMFTNPNNKNIQIEVSLMQNANPDREVVNKLWLENFNKKLFGNSYKTLEGETWKEVAVNGKDSVQIVQPPQRDFPQQAQHTSIGIYIPLNEDILLLVVTFKENTQVDQDMVNQILSTFRLLD